MELAPTALDYIMAVALAAGWLAAYFYHFKRRLGEERRFLEQTVGRDPRALKGQTRQRGEQRQRSVGWAAALAGAPCLSNLFLPAPFAWGGVGLAVSILLLSYLGSILYLVIYRARLRGQREADLEAWANRSGELKGHEGWMTRDVAGMLVLRPTRRGEGVLRLLAAAGVLLFFSTPLVGTLQYRLTTLDWGTHVFQRAQWASTVAAAAWLAAAAALAAWLLGTSLRLIFGLPARRPGKLRWLFNLGRAGLFLYFGFWLIIWGAEEMTVRKVAYAPYKALGMGLVLCGLLAYDIPRLLRRGMACLRVRRPLSRSRKASLADLQQEGRYHLTGKVSALEPAPEGLPRGVVFRRWERRDVENRVLIKTEAAPFILWDGGEQARVEARADNLVVHLGAGQRTATGQTMDGQPATISDICDGDRVHLIGDVRPAEGGPFRQGAASVEAAIGPMLMFTRARAMGRRLLLAGVVELVSAATLAACVLGLVAFWAYIGLVLP